MPGGMQTKTSIFSRLSRLNSRAGRYHDGRRNGFARDNSNCFSVARLHSRFHRSRPHPMPSKSPGQMCTLSVRSAIAATCFLLD